jgi:outer membrane protein
MKRFVTVALVLAAALPLLAGQRRVDLILDLEGVRRTGKADNTFTPDTLQFRPTFSTGGGLGGGVNWFFSDRISLEAKVAGLGSHLHVRTTGSDFVANVDLGTAQIYPISTILQWHMTEHGTLRPYLGAGGAHIIIRNINRRAGTINGVKFSDPTGFVVDVGLEVRLSPRWSLTGDARYIPIETNSRATFGGSGTPVRMHVKPLIVSFGTAYHY